MCIRWIKTQTQQLEFTRKDLEHGKRVLVLGGGFAGLNAAKTLCSKLSSEIKTDGSVQVLLVNRWNYHLFTPLLYQAATGMVDLDSIAQAIRPEARKSGFDFLEADITSINVQGQIIYTKDRSIPYDYLVIALGSIKDESKLKGAADCAIPLKTLEDGNRIHNRILESFEIASGIEPGEKGREAYLNFVIIGGTTGAELAGSVIDYIKAATNAYPKIDCRRDCSVYLIEADEKLFPTRDKSISDIVRRSLEVRGVKVILNTKVEEIKDLTKVVLSNGETVKSWNIFDNTGTRPNPVIDSMPDDIVKKKRGKLVVDQNLRIQNFPNVFAIGDNAEVIGGYSEEGNPRHAPPTAESAVEEGKYVGKLIASELNFLSKTGGKKQLRVMPFRFREKGVMLSIGMRSGIAKFSWHTFTGFLGWLIWRMVHLYLLASARSKITVAFEWTLDAFSGRNIAQIGKVEEN